MLFPLWTTVLKSTICVSAFLRLVGRVQAECALGSAVGLSYHCGSSTIVQQYIELFTLTLLLVLFQPTCKLQYVTLCGSEGAWRQAQVFTGSESEENLSRITIM